MKWLLVLCGALIASAVNIPRVPVDFDVDDKTLSSLASEIAAHLEKEYLTYLRTGVETQAFKQLTTNLANSHSKKDIFTKNLPDLDARDSFLSCTLCRASVNVFAHTIRDEDGELHGEDSTEIMRAYALDVCRRLNLQTEEVCSGLINSNIDTVEYIMRNSEIDSQSFCSLFLSYGICNTGTNEAYNWTLTVDGNGETMTGSKSNTPKLSDKDLKICHLSDIHHDPLYTPGSLASCAEPLCCQRNKDTVEGTSEAAGYWGDYRDCDLPWHTFESAVDHAVKTAECDIVYQTGDINDHMNWATSVEKNTKVLSDVNNKLTEAFGDVPVYSCIGNHEPHPFNLFSPPDAPEYINTKWLYEHLYNDWSKWLPAETKETILKGGYYTVVARKGLRIISLNSNECYTENFWLYNNGTDKIAQLEWFHDTLLAAEAAEESVHVLGHIPSGSGNCWATWAREYNRIITRFHKTISGIFNGHTHKDELAVHCSEEGYATAVAWTGGAVTTRSNKNPNYRVYTVDPETYHVTNHYTYMFNLTEANLQPDKEPEWFLEYEFAKEFTEDLSPAGIDKLLDDFADNPELMRKYWRFRVTNADPQVTQGCDRNCLASSLCRASVTVNNQRDKCDERRARLFAALDIEEGVTTADPTDSTGSTEGSTGGTTGSTSGGTDDGTTDSSTEDPDKDDGAAAITSLGIATMMALVLFVTLSY